ncbi:PTS sugar transporter subunit IIC [Clostridium sardiniense]|uniref:PTS sugar transporter subunit IIC n=1 Tax=Clostridium sardiniense TaxID=29369 RepID=UPI00195EEDBA|nr:PTS transporter subunit EIIC [Clostridium sardiniense]MBM7835015.1 PTS system cellobiose-specific IIC component [Clostridium sardiniense]
MGFMDRFATWLEKVMMPIASKLGSQKHLAALRDGFIAYLPISLIGAFGTMFLNVLLKPDSLVGKKLNEMDAWASSVQPVIDKYISPVFTGMWWGTLAMTTIFLLITVAYAYCRSQDVDPLAGATVAVAAYLAMVPDTLKGVIVKIDDVEHAVDIWGNISWASFNSTAMFAGLVVALLSAQLFCYLTKKGWVIKMPDQVPPAVSRAFSAVIPAIVTVFVFALISMLFISFIGVDYKTWIDKTIQEPLTKFGQSPFAYIGLITLSQFFWFFGLHGLNMVEPALNTMYLPTLNANIEAVNQGKEAIHIFTRNFVDVYAMPGGSGGTLALLLAIFIFSKRQESRELAKLAIVPGVFQINEPVIFGLPIVLNPIYFIPFAIIPGILCTIAYFATQAGLVSKISAFIPWTCPPILSAFLATNGDFRATLLALLLFILALVIWAPFVIAANKIGNNE